MVSIPTGLAINTSVAADRITAGGMRRALGALVQQSAPGVPLAGVLYAPGNPLQVSTMSTMGYGVKAGYAVTTRTGQGIYIVGTAEALTIPTATADTVNPRYDRIYIVQPDPELAETGTARIDVAVGKASSNPALPVLPTGALELGRKLVPANAVGTNAGGAITNTPRYVGVDWDSVQNKPSTFTPSAHHHSTSDLTDASQPGRDFLALTTQQQMREALGIFVDGDPGVRPAGSIWIRKA